MEEYPINHRRTFIKKFWTGIALTQLGSIPFVSSANNDDVIITVLHTNDVHSHIDPFDSTHPKYPGQGGVAIRSAMINKIRSTQPNVLLFDAGDIFQGTPYFNLYGGELEFKLMSHMQYDAATLGNHDFDNGIDGFVKQLPHARFPFLNCNYDFSSTLLNQKIGRFKIFNKDGVRIGVTGVGIDLKGLVSKKLYGNVKYSNPVERLNETAAFLKYNKKCDLVICLSHLGLKYTSNKVSDLVLAKNSEHVDMIIGGHTHTFLEEAVREKNRLGIEVLVTQAGWAGLRLGRADFTFERQNKRKNAAIYSMKEMTKSSEK